MGINNITDKDICGICLDDIVNPYQLNCNHVFCKSCIQDYKNSSLKEPLAALCGYEVWGMDNPTDVTSCHEFSSDNYRHTTDQKAFAVFQVSGNQLLFEVKNNEYPTYFGLNSFTRK